MEGGLGEYWVRETGRRKTHKGCVEEQLPLRILGSILLDLGETAEQASELSQRGTVCWSVSTPTSYLHQLRAALGT